MIVLYYIRNNSSRFGTFVATRISEIREHSTIEQWNHVIGALNPDDLVSRQTVFNYASLSEWFIGPMFLTGLSIQLCTKDARIQRLSIRRQWLVPGICYLSKKCECIYICLQAFIVRLSPRFSSKRVDDLDSLLWYIHYFMRIYVIKEKASLFSSSKSSFLILN